MSFHISFCNPLEPAIVELGIIDGDRVVDQFSSIRWESYLEEMKGKPQEEIFYSPSFEIENTENKNALSISAVGEPENYEFYIFYKRPKIIKSFLDCRRPISMII